MANRIKSVLFFISLVVLPYCCSAQIGEYFISDLPKTNLHPLSMVVIKTTTPYPNRYGALWYRPFSFNNEQVISVSNKNSINDQVYYLDNKGELKYRSMAITAPMNQYFNQEKLDSFNPYGTSNLGQSLVQGALNILFGSF
ncbi:MAG: hypothetical protein RIG77_15625 [Cyclobacteriaceae bacterium]